MPSSVLRNFTSKSGRKNFLGFSTGIFGKIADSHYKQKSIIPLEERIELYRTLYTYVSNKLNPEFLFKRKRRSGSKAMHAAYRRINLSLERGASLSESVRPFIPHDEYIFVNAAEQQPTMELMLDQLVNMVSQKTEQAKAFKQAAVLPIVAYFVSLFIMALVIFFIGPMIMDIVGGEAKKMIWVPTVFYPALITFFPIILAGTPALLIFIIWWMPNGGRSPLRSIVDRIVPFSAYKEYVASQFMIITAASLEGRISFNQSVLLQVSVAPRYLKSWLVDIRSRFKSGDYSDIAGLDIGLIGPKEMDIIQDYDQTHDFSIAMIRVGKNSLERTTEKIKSQFKITALVTGVVAVISIVLVVGVFIAFMASNIATPGIDL